MPPTITQDDQSHLRLASEQHLREAGRLLIAFVQADVSQLDNLSELEKLAISLVNPVALRRFDNRLGQLEREQARAERERARKVEPYPTHLALSDF